MSKIGTTIAFLAGAAIGGGAVWYFTKDIYARRAEEEINSVKEAYARREQQKNETEPDEQHDMPAVATPVASSHVQDKGNITEFARRVQGEERYTNYSKTVVPEKPAEEKEPEPEDAERPYVISPDEFDELDYTIISLTYYADGVLADEHGVIVEDVEEIIGDGLEHFGEYEEDSVFVRSDARRCDYEIMRSLDTYEEFRKTLPSNI